MTSKKYIGRGQWVDAPTANCTDADCPCDDEPLMIPVWNWAELAEADDKDTSVLADNDLLIPPRVI
jgi:hypothetical protein